MFSSGPAPPGSPDVRNNVRPDELGNCGQLFKGRLDVRMRRFSAGLLVVVEPKINPVAKIKIKNPRIRAGIGPKPTISQFFQK